MTTTFFFQGERMDVRVGGINIPASGLNAFNTIIIIILIPIVDRGLYPFLQRIGRPLTHLQRMGKSFVLCFILFNFVCLHLPFVRKSIFIIFLSIAK